MRISISCCASFLSTGPLLLAGYRKPLRHSVAPGFVLPALHVVCPKTLYNLLLKHLRQLLFQIWPLLIENVLNAPYSNSPPEGSLFPFSLPSTLPTLSSYINHITPFLFLSRMDISSDRAGRGRDHADMNLVLSRHSSWLGSRQMTILKLVPPNDICSTIAMNGGRGGLCQPDTESDRARLATCRVSRLCENEGRRTRHHP